MSNNVTGGASSSSHGGINPRYDSQNAYGVAESHYNNGKYPPDWPARREAVWDRQRYQCGRCGVYKGDATVNEVHHVVHLSQGGPNSLDNLVGLCGDCHALMHPDVDALDGTVDAADVFPDDESDDRVAVVRKPRGNDDLRTDVARLSAISTPDANSNAVSEACVPTSSATARRARRSLRELLLDHGLVPRTTAYHRISVRPKPRGLLAAITRKGVDLTASSDSEALEVDDEESEVYLSADTAVSNLELRDAAGKTREEELSLEGAEGARLRVEKPVSAPPLTASTAPGYAIGAFRYFGWTPLKIGVLPALVLSFLAPSLVPGGVSVASVLALSLFVGLLVRSPTIYRDATGTPADRVVDERAESE